MGGAEGDTHQLCSVNEMGFASLYLSYRVVRVQLCGQPATSIRVISAAGAFMPPLAF